MDEGQVKQGTREWKQSRNGFITSSGVHNLMKEPKLKADKEAGNLSESAKTYILDVIASECSLKFEVNTAATTWGSSQEALARHFYEKRTGMRVDECGFLVSDIEGYGGSPDGIITLDDGVGITEIKCPFNPSNHLEYCLIEKADDIPDEYYWQMMSNMYVCKANWCDFISFDPRIDSDIGLFVFRIFRENEKEKETRMLSKIKKAIAYKNELKVKLKLA